MADPITVKVEGLTETLAAFKKFEGDVAKGLKKELRGAAGLVAIEAKNIAESKGLHQSGDLIKNIRPGFRSFYSYVADTAQHGGYNYPARIEYEKKYGDRAFLNPAADAKKTEVEAMVALMVERYTAEFNASELKVR